MLIKNFFAILALLLFTCAVVSAQTTPIKKTTPASPDESANQRAEAILKLAREAKGGVDKLKQVTDLVYSGDFISYDSTGNQHLPLTMFLQEHKVRTDAGPNSSGYDGNIAWFNDAVVEPDKRSAYESRRRGIREWFINLLRAPSGMNLSATAVPDSEVNGKPVSVVAIEIEEHKFKVSFDKQTHLALKLSYAMLDGTEEIQLDEIQEDYKIVDGIKFSHRQIGLENGKASGEMAVKEYKINRGIDPVKFTRR